MSLDELCDQLVRLGHQKTNFGVGDIETNTAWLKAEKRLGRQLPSAWLTFMKKYGCGGVLLKNDYSRPGVSVSSILAEHATDHSEDSVTESSLMVVFYDSNCIETLYQLEEDRVAPSSGLPEPHQDWVLVGGNDEGDHLALFVPRNATARLADASVGWHNHEASRFIHLWPSVFSFLETLLRMHAVAK
jgi:hypothetical protein